MILGERFGGFSCVVAFVVHVLHMITHVPLKILAICFFSFLCRSGAENEPRNIEFCCIIKEGGTCCRFGCQSLRKETSASDIPAEIRFDGNWLPTNGILSCPCCRCYTSWASIGPSRCFFWCSFWSLQCVFERCYQHLAPLSMWCSNSIPKRV